MLSSAGAHRLPLHVSPPPAKVSPDRIIGSSFDAAPPIAKRALASVDESAKKNPCVAM
jgi:hypothetical protein